MYVALEVMLDFSRVTEFLEEALDVCGVDIGASAFGHCGEGAIVDNKTKALRLREVRVHLGGNEQVIILKSQSLRPRHRM